ncbi:hypothetical protein ACHQM5_022446 [Ranunculus cassubicifolius]
MSLSRLASLALQRRSLNLVQRLGSRRSSQCRSFCDAPKYSKKRAGGNQLYSDIPPEEVKSKSWLKYILVAPLLCVVGGGILIHRNDEKRAVLKGQGNECRKSNIYGPRYGGPFSLFDTEQRRVTERDLMGNWVLLYFGYTSSPDVGPEEVQKMAKVLKILDSKENVRIVPLFVTLDPQRDSPAQLRAYLKEFDPRIVGLTGPGNSVRQMAQEYRVFFKKIEEDGNDYLIDSSHRMYLLEPNHEIVRCFGVEYDAEKLSEEIATEINKASK